uniref:Uncharacterized protein n=1 Tax=Monopterus albus TaxID=43700 RepID=A0A3Q3IWK0_MONAL
FSLSGTCESLCNFNLSLGSSLTHSGAEVEGRSEKPEAVSQSSLDTESRTNSLLLACTSTVQCTTCVLLQMRVASLTTHRRKNFVEMFIFKEVSLYHPMSEKENGCIVTVFYKEIYQKRGNQRIAICINET